MLRQLFQHSLIYGIATVVSRGALVAALLLLALILDPTDYGALGMVTVMSALVALVVPLEISQGLARHYPTAPETGKPAYASTAFWFTAASLALFALVAEVFAGPITRILVGEVRFLPAIRLAIVSMSLTAMLYFIQAQLRWEFRPYDYVVTSLVYAVFTFGGSLGLATLIDPPLSGVYLGQALGALAAIAVGLPRIRRSLRFRFDGPKLKEMLRFSFPIVPASIALFVGAYAARIILNAYENLEAVGVFTFASQVAGLIVLTIVGVQAALTPLIMSQHSEPQTPMAIATAFEAFCALALIACLALGLAAPEAIRLLRPEGYEAAGPLVMLIAPGLIMREMYIFAPGFSVAKRTGRQLAVSVASAIIGVAVTVPLILYFGLMGAAWGLVLSGLVFLGLWFAASQRLYKVPVRWGKILAGVLIAAAASAAGLILDGHELWLRLAAKVVLFLIAAGAMVLSGIVNRDRLIALIGR